MRLFDSPAQYWSSLRLAKSNRVITESGQPSVSMCPLKVSGVVGQRSRESGMPSPSESVRWATAASGASRSTASASIGPVQDRTRFICGFDSMPGAGSQQPGAALGNDGPQCIGFTRECHAMALISSTGRSPFGQGQLDLAHE